MTQSESILIGQIINDSRVFPDVLRIVTGGEMFFNRELGNLYTVMVNDFMELGAVDLSIISARHPALTPLATECCGNATNTHLSPGVHARVVAEAYMRSVASKTLKELQSSVTGPDDVFDAIQGAISILERLRGGFGKDSVEPVGRSVDDTLGWIDDIRSGRASETLRWGFIDLDKLTGGMDFGDLVIVAAPEKSGKTVLMVQTIFNNLRRGIPCMIFSGEMKAHHILLRMALMETRTNYFDMRNNRLHPAQWAKLQAQIAEYAKLPLYIRYGSFTILEIKADVERFVREKGVKLVAVDYVQRVLSIDRKSNDNREREVAAISSALKDIAMTQNVVVMALSQVNQDLRARESRAIEHDMDKMITIDAKVGESVQQLGLRQRMGRSGDVGVLSLAWDKDFGCWRNSATEFQQELETNLPTTKELPF